MGRPRIPRRSILLTAGLRAFEDLTAGAAVVAAENYRLLGLVSMGQPPTYNTLLREFAMPSYMPLYHRLVAASALPLIPLERTFAVDATGFGTSVYDCHRDEKHGSTSKRRTPTPRHRWIKAHLVLGMTTQVIAAAQITEGNVAGCPMMEELLKRTIANGGNVREWLGDSAYNASYNIAAVEAVGAMPYFDWRDGVTGATNPIQKRLYLKFRSDPEAYEDRYHQRSKAESGMHQIKTRFSHRTRSRTPNAMYAELMLRCVSHNIAMVVQAIEEFGIEPKFWTSPATAPLIAALPLAAQVTHEP